MECHVLSLYDKIKDNGNAPSLACLQQGLKGYYLLKLTGQLDNERYLTLIDMSLASSLKRLWVIDMQTREVLFNELVAHGKNSGDKFATSFSNAVNSLKSSLGFYTTGDIYSGKHQLSLKLHGLEYGFNNNAFARGIVIHGADYVSEQIAGAEDRIGRSFGCPAVPLSKVREITSTIAYGSCLFIYYPDKRYQQKSDILNSEQYIPFEWLGND